MPQLRKLSSTLEAPPASCTQPGNLDSHHLQLWRKSKTKENISLTAPHNEGRAHRSEVAAVVLPRSKHQQGRRHQRRRSPLNTTREKVSRFKCRRQLILTVKLPPSSSSPLPPKPKRKITAMLRRGARPTKVEPNRRHCPSNSKCRLAKTGKLLPRPSVSDHHFSGGTH